MILFPYSLTDLCHVLAVCDVPCHNGGKCVAPSVCECAPGYSGTNCQEDINECLLGEDVHKCLGDSVCVNRVGWFYCACKKGYKSYHNPLDKTTSCTDIDECEEKTHTCHESALCLNTLGSYSCYCGERSHQQCSTGKRHPGYIRLIVVSARLCSWWERLYWREFLGWWLQPVQLWCRQGDLLTAEVWLLCAWLWQRVLPWVLRQEKLQPSRYPRPQVQEWGEVGVSVYGVWMPGE